MDRYHHDLSHLPPDERSRMNFDRPRALDVPRLLADLNLLARGLPCRMPGYDFSSHTRTSRTTPLVPARFVIIEGLFALAIPRVRHLLDAGIYISVPLDICLQRRIARDVEGRGRDHREVTGRFQRDVVPSTKTHVEPQRAHADLVLDGTGPVDENALRAAQWIRRLRVAKKAEKPARVPKGCESLDHPRIPPMMDASAPLPEK
jgi:uridine kinase